MMTSARTWLLHVACALLAVCVATGLLSACARQEIPVELGESTSTHEAEGLQEEVTSAPEVEDDVPLDAVNEYAAYLVASDDGCNEYQIFVCGCDTRTLLSMADETIFLKSAGYTERILKDLDFDELWPGVSELDFATAELIDRDDYLLAVVRFEDLDDPENLKALVDTGILDVAEGTPQEPLDADELMRLTVERGGKLLSKDDEALEILEF